MELNREEDIRTHIETWLKQQGVAVDREVSCGNGIRADLVTSDTVIEVKKYLNRGAIYQAHGQGIVYQKHLNRPKLLIIGLAPTSETRYQEAQRIAENIRADGVEVIFLDKDPHWSTALAQVTARSAADPPSTVKPTAAKSTATKPSAAKSSAVKDVQLPFEKLASRSDTEPPSAPNSKSDRGSGLSLTPRDMWTLLLIILLFLWVRSAIETVNQSAPTDYDTQPIPETLSPSP